MLTISQLASYAGVTVRAVRHYHAKGLLPEPERDTSGYRRYAVASVVELIRIRTLAEAGVPLVRVRELLRADEEELANAVTEIDARLRAEIRDRQQHRRRIAQLAAGDGLALPEASVAYLQRLRELGFASRMVELERDAWTIIAAHSPELMPMFIAAKQQQLDDQKTLSIMRDLMATVDWQPDDPRLPALADRLVELFENDLSSLDQTDEHELPDDIVDLLDAVFFEMVPIARRLVQLLEERGWSGWTQLKPI